MQPGEYPRDTTLDHGNLRLRPLPSVFAPRKLTLKEGETPKPLVIRATPHVVVEARYYDSKGQPLSGLECLFHGWIDGNSWHVMPKADSGGKIVIHAPHGLDNAQFDFLTNERECPAPSTLEGRAAQKRGLHAARDPRPRRQGDRDHPLRGPDPAREGRG